MLSLSSPSSSAPSFSTKCVLNLSYESKSYILLMSPSRYSSDAGTGLENSTCSKETLSPSLFGKETAAAHSVVSPMFVNGNDMPTRSFWAYMRSQSATNDAVSPTTGPFRPTARILECDVKRCTRYRFLALTSDSISLLDLFLSLATVLMLAPAENIGPLATRRVTRVDG